MKHTYTDEEVAALRDLAALETGGCTEWSCTYHGRTNKARAVLRQIAAASPLTVQGTTQPGEAT